VSRIHFEGAQFRSDLGADEAGLEVVPVSQGTIR